MQLLNTPGYDTITDMTLLLMYIIINYMYVLVSI